MPLDQQEPLPRYTGPFVCIRPADDLAWSVSIEPILPTGEGEPRTFGSKHEAFGAARELWQAHRLPVRDFTDGNVSSKLNEK